MNIGFTNALEEMDSIPLHMGIKPIKETKSINLYYFTKANSTWDIYNFATFLADKNWLKRKLRYESFFAAREQGVNLEINPIITLEEGRDVGNNDQINMYKNTRGFIANVHLTEKFSFSTSFYENQMRVQSYLMAYANYTGPRRPNGAGNYVTDSRYDNFFGQGRTKPFKSQGVDFAMATGYISYSPVKNFNFQFGTDKHFIGYGYRSLLLSDNSFVYPFVKSSIDFLKGRLKYISMFASMQSLNRLPIATTPEATFERKAFSMNYLSFIINKKFEMGVMEATVWQRMDKFQQLKFDYSLLNPVMFLNSIRFGFDGLNNTLLGIQGKYRIRNGLFSYAQIMFDGIKDRFKGGTQAGVLWNKPFGFKNWTTRFEYNYVSKYSYTNATKLQNYAHYNSPLAHPWGAGFNEWILFVHWRMRDFFVDQKFIYGIFNTYNYQEYGKDIFLADTPPSAIVMKKYYKTIYYDFKIGYVINPITNLRMQLGITNYYRLGVNDRTNSNYIYFGLSTSLTNFYLDI